MSEKPSVIEVVEVVEQEVSATGADLRITVSGARYFAGEAALQQAFEVRKVIESLAEAGIAESDVGIASVRVDTTKGVLLRSSSATYELRVRCRDPKRVAGAVDATAGQKNLSLSQVVWRYDVPEETRHAWLARAVKQARAAAEAMASAAGQQVLRPLRIVDETLGAGSDWDGHGASMAPGSYGGSLRSRSASKTRRVVDSLEDLELAPKQTESVKVRAWFVIGDA